MNLTFEDHVDRSGSLDHELRLILGEQFNGMGIDQRYHPPDHGARQRCG